MLGGGHDPLVVQEFGGARFEGGRGGDGTSEGIGGGGGGVTIQTTAHQTNNCK
ncbi:hypothetical protein CVT26_015294 [Gymnopilus dilepis]|uniref:Uncharacterized protein n=1 Tax=Gymnopilus dilepis TaxID=231916 RepID=A0A409W9Z1_9AGAR|nr:hypothetical protein CVT26_015294 [Gymnopilus dilepis]